MKTIFKLFFVIFISIPLMSYGNESDLQTVYTDYLVSIQAMKSMSETDYQSFLSARAKAIVSDKISAVDESQLNSFLTFFKAEAVLPENSQINLNNAKQDVPILEIVAEDYPEKGSKHQQYVSFVRENGWKIDKIEVITSGEGFEFKSTTY